MSRIKIITTIFFFSVFLLSACNNSTENQVEGGSNDKPYIALVSEGYQQEFWQYVQEGAEEAAEEYDVEISFEGPDKETEVEKQINMLETAINKQPDAIGFAPLDSEASIPLIEQADQQDIPIVTFDAELEGSDIPVSFVATDNIAAGAEAADNLAEQINEKGKVALVAQSQSERTAVDRRDGFLDQLKEEYPDIEVVAEEYTEGDPLKTIEAAKSIISSNPDLKGLYATNEGGAIGLAQSIEETDIDPDEIAIVGFDSGKQQIDAIKDGIINGSITQSPHDIGYQTVEAAVKTLEGEDVEEVIPTDFFWYDKENMDDEEIQNALYE